MGGLGNLGALGPEWVIGLSLFLGLFVGSFLNVVIHRLPLMMEREWQLDAAEIRQEPASTLPKLNLAIPRSHCPHCGHEISALENIPLLSYLLLRGRCRQCKASISIRYPFVEALTSILSALVAWKFGASEYTACALIFLWALIALAFIDLDTQFLPDDITLPLVWFGLFFNLVTNSIPLEEALIGAMGGYLSLWSVYWAFKLITGKEGMGYGDFKLLAAIGAFLGWKILPVVILLSSAVGAVIGVGMIVLAQKSRETPIPFGPYLATAGILALFFGQALNTLFFPV